MESDVYHLVTINDGKSDSDAIVKVLSEIAAGALPCDLKLVNYFDQLPVSYAATITNMDKDSVEMAVHEYQAIIMKHDKSTLIKSRHFHNQLSVHCYTGYVNATKKTAIVHNFAYAQIRAERREAVRVKVRGKLPVLFCYDCVSFAGDIVDISGNGISILSNLVPMMATGQTGILRFALLDMPLEAPGSFVRSRTSGTDGHICVFEMKPERRNDNTIAQFIYQRQVEIVKELKDGAAID